MHSTFWEQETGKPARILSAAEELVRKRGFKGVTMSEVAKHAHVGKGTVYLYWPTKEALFIGLLARSFLSVLDELVEHIGDRPGLARPDLLCPELVHGVLRQPLVRALQTSDAEVLGALVDDPRSQEMVDRRGAAALIRALLPVWRRHGLARTDWELERQAWALQMLAVGFLETTVRTAAHSNLDAADRDATTTEAVAALLGTTEISPEAEESTAREATEVFEEMKAALRTSLNEEG